VCTTLNDGLEIVQIKEAKRFIMGEGQLALNHGPGYARIRTGLCFRVPWAINIYV